MKKKAKTSGRKTAPKKRLRIRKNIDNSMRTFRQKIIGWVSVANGGGAAISYPYGVSLNFPTYVSNNAGTYGQIANFGVNLNRFTAAFSEYKVNKLTVRFEPNIVDTTAAAAANDFPNSVYIEQDQIDMIGTMTDQLALAGGRSPKSYADGKAVKLYMRNTSNNKKIWISTTQIGSLPGANPTNLQLSGATLYGGIKFLFPAVTNNTNIGRIYCEWDVIFRGVKLE